MKKIKISLLGKVILAIAAGILFGQFLPAGVVRLFVTFNSLFSEFLSFAIPLIIVGLVTPAIGELGRGAGKLLLITALLAYGSTIFSGFFTYFSCELVFPYIIPANAELVAADNPGDFMLQPYFTVAMPPLMDVMTALLLSFTFGLGLSNIPGTALRDVFRDIKEIVTLLIEEVIIPLLPLHIFGIFLNMTVSGQVMSIITMFLKVILVIFILHVLLLLIQFFVAGSVAKKNPFRLLRNMLPAYATALGTQSSAATIPVTCDHPFGGKHVEDRGLLNGHPDHVERADPVCPVQWFYHDAGHRYGGGSGRTGWRDHGGFGDLAGYAWL